MDNVLSLAEHCIFKRHGPIPLPKPGLRITSTTCIVLKFLIGSSPLPVDDIMYIRVPGSHTGLPLVLDEVHLPPRQFVKDEPSEFSCFYKFMHGVLCEVVFCWQACTVPLSESMHQMNTAIL